jgi:hypothetical protein
MVEEIRDIVPVRLLASRVRRSRARKCDGGGGRRLLALPRLCVCRLIAAAQAARYARGDVANICVYYYLSLEEEWGSAPRTFLLPVYELNPSSPLHSAA